MKTLKYWIAAGIATLLSLGELSADNVIFESVRQNYPWSNLVEIKFHADNPSHNKNVTIKFQTSVSETPSFLSFRSNSNRPYDIPTSHIWIPPSGIRTADCTMTAEIFHEDEHVFPALQPTDQEVGQYLVPMEDEVEADYMIINLNTFEIWFGKLLNTDQLGELNGVENEYEPTLFRDEKYKKSFMVLRHIDKNVNPTEHYLASYNVAGEKIEGFCNVRAGGYWIGIYPVTCAQYATVMRDVEPAYSSDDDVTPATGFSWMQLRGLEDRGDETDEVSVARHNLRPGIDFAFDQKGFFSVLNKRLIERGFPFPNLDLPTSAMWKIAARANTESDLFYGRSDDNGVYFFGNAGEVGGDEAKVGRLLPNQWGIYDLYGNVAEWCLDCEIDFSSTIEKDAYIANTSSTGWDKTVRTVRGMTNVSCLLSGENARADTMDSSIGFRVARFHP